MHDLEEGAPRGWKFTLPSGDPQEGRQVFVELECYKCHAVHGERFPATESEPGRLGPDLTGMGIHAAEYLAESVINPNAVIVEGKGFTGEDGLSTMPSYNDTITMTQLIDLVAYLKTLTEVGEREGQHHH
jgi:mono/diheme cytochrome c family protein